MIGRKTFPRGGVHPYERKSLSEHKRIWNAAVPSECIVPLQQHIGKPAEAQVGPGDEVREGRLIGKASGFVSASVHSPIPGVVRELREVYLANGLATTAVVIDLQGEFDRLGKQQMAAEWRDRDVKSLLTSIRKNGVVGMGGATFPTHVKYTLPQGKTCDWMILNGVECEPYLTADHRLMLEMTDQVIEGLEIAARILDVEHVAIGIEENKPDVIEEIRSRVKERRLDFRVVILETKYPQGGEKQLIKAITDREVPSGGLPIDVGCMVSNAGTLNAVYEAVVFDKPLMERVVSVTGGAVREPGNLKARIGTTFGELIEECGGLAEIPQKVVAGGPMTGFAVYDLDMPLIKGTSGILALTAREVNEAPRTPCINCGRCIAACPMGLQPTALFKYIDHEEYEPARALGLSDCIECGACSYVCPAHIPLVQGMRIGKRIARKKG
ncbi:MAG: electron transport complex subunit RsxC [Spirochaetes bacterium]|jgi:electron transport complex protein RnfC|nr:electron transport complex subunit RsxC [Spirochaetota bacterium]